MSRWISLLNIFFEYQTSLILKITEGKLHGVIYKDHIVTYSNTSNEKPFQLENIVHNINNLEEIMQLYYEYAIIIDQKKCLPVVNNKLSFVGLWNYLNIIYAWDELPIIKTWGIPKIRPNAETKNLKESLTTLVLETLPIQLLTLNTKGNILFCSEDWLSLQKKFPKELSTSMIFKQAKQYMIQYALHESINMDKAFKILSLPPENELYMKFITFQGKAIGYLFWFQQVIGTKNKLNYDNQSLKSFLQEQEKNIIAWALKKHDNDHEIVAKSLKVSLKKFETRYKQLFCP